MWYCPSCGTENGGNASFCTECGSPRPSQAPKGQPQPVQPQPVQPQPVRPQPVQAQPVRQNWNASVNPTPPPVKKKKSRWWLWLLVALVVLAAAAVTCYFTVHIWAPATCTEPETCRICGETRGAPLGHDASEATCVNPSICSRCHTVLGAPLGHDAPAATCTEPSVCRRCGEEVSPALGHQWQGATYDRPDTCSVCGETRGEVKGWVGTPDGYMGTETLKLYGNCESHPYILYSTINRIYRITVHIKLTKVDGDPYGTWGVYGRQTNGSWVQLGTFNVSTTAYNNFVSFPLQLDGSYSIDALTLVPITDNQYSLSFSFDYTDVQEYVD